MDEGISLMLPDAIYQSGRVANVKGHRDDSLISSRTSEAASVGGTDDSLTRALDELRLRDSGVEDDNEEEEVEPGTQEVVDLVFPEVEVERAIKRCQSLSNSASQKRSARRSKKVVRFADALGLELTNVRHFGDGSETPPLWRPDTWRTQPPPTRPQLFVNPCFSQPETRAGFLALLCSQKVLLERAGTDHLGGITGIVRVSNLHFEKRVTALVTFDKWQSYREVPAKYQTPDAWNLRDPATDRFVFHVPLISEFRDRLHLCVKYEVAGQTFWDNNFGENYAFDYQPIGKNGWSGCGALSSFR